MSTKKVIVYFTGAVLATEIITKHGEESSHTHSLKYPIYNNSMVVNVYNIPYNQYEMDTTISHFPTLEL